jgi:signal transduction histidine kinase/ActR/RegA family two-component response regulator
MQPVLRLTDWFIPRHVLDGSAEAVRRARTIVLFCLVLEAWVPVFALTYWLLVPRPASIWLCAGVGCFGGLNIAILLVGRRVWAAHFSGLGILGVLSVAILYIIWLSGGSDSPALWWVVLLPVLATTLGERSYGFGMAAICALAILGIRVVEDCGLEPPYSLPSETRPVVVAVAQVSLMTALFALALAYELAKEAALGALARSNYELEDARRLAVTASRTKSEFLANMSHELRTPMTAIVGFAELLSEDNTTKPEHAEALEIIRRNGDHLLRLINDILDLSKVEAGRLDLTHERCEPVELVAEVAQLMRVRAESRGLELLVEWSTDAPQSIETDVARLRQILINLLGNAIKFTELGTVRLCAALVKQPHGMRLELEVRDTGIGMTRDALERAFDPFTQADASVSRRYGGTGLGLAICKRLAELLGAEISATSELGVGSAFRLSLPIATADAEARVDAAAWRPEASAPLESVTPPAAAAPARAKRVLVAEDGPDNQRLLAVRLRRAGAEVTIVENGALAVTHALHGVRAGRPFDVVLMDMQMPVLDGYAATRSLRAQGYRGQIVALTAHAMQGDRERCLDAGCDDYLAKPVDVNALLELLRRCRGGK